MNSAHNLLDLPFLPRRVAVAREEAGLSQDRLAKLLGFKDRQTLTAIEAGQRKVSAEDLMALMHATGKDYEFFTDPLRLVGEAAFSYRAAGCSEEELGPFEAKAGQWLALWRFLGEKRGESASPLRPRLAINERSTFEEAQLVGEQVAKELKLGAVPAEKLAEAIESAFGILVLWVDMPEGVSGAAVQLASGDAILINRKEAAGRRAFDLAHELFHVLTWDALPPQRVDRENPKSYKAKRTEQLADNFAGALLMPAADLKERWTSRSSESSEKKWLVTTSAHYHVSVPALCWRMVALNLIKREDVLKLLRTPSPEGTRKQLPQFSRRFLERIVWGIDHGEIAVRRMLKLLRLELGEFRNQCAQQGVQVEIGL